MNRTKTFILLLLFTFSASLILPSCTQEKLPPPNIVWLTSEDNSIHYMKLYSENGIETPNIESLAEHGLTYTHAFSNAPVCSAARSTLISGCYGPRVAAHYHRKMVPVPMPETVEMYPAYLKKAGYYTTNNNKEDYNLLKGDNVWDDSSKKATWRNRAEGQPFFHVQNYVTTHESRLHFPESDMINKPTKTDLNSFDIQPNHPQTDLFRYTNARYRDKIVEMDTQIGDLLKELEKDGLMENTFIFYYGDHGGVLPGSKGYIYETGLHVPLVIYVPDMYKKWVNAELGSKVDGFVSFADFAPTVLALAGAEIPADIDGKAFLGKDVDWNEVNQRDETFGYADRFDEKYDMVRTLRKGKYKYMRSFQPFNFDGLMNNYRYKQAAYREWSELSEKGELNDVQDFFFHKRDAELLYDVEADLFETKNLAQNPEFKDILLEMRTKMTNQLKSMPDLAFYPEFYLINNAFDNQVAFGQAHKDQINKYIEIANIQFDSFDKNADKLAAALKSNDPWTRYWALITCSYFDKEAAQFISIIITMIKDDSDSIYRVRAAEYLGIINEQNPVNDMLNALYSTHDAAEALLIFNSIVLMQDAYGYEFDIEPEKLQEEVTKEKLIDVRLSYLVK